MPVLNLLADGVVAQSYSLNKPVTRIGRLPACDISIDDPSSSGLHAQIEINNGSQAEGIIAQQVVRHAVIIMWQFDLDLAS